MPRRIQLSVVIVFSMILMSGCSQILNPTADVELQQALWDLQDLLVELRDETAILQGQVDSLHWVVARQDSSIRMISNLIGSPIR